MSQQNIKRYGLAIFQSFYNPQLYAEVISVWKGIAAKYAILLSVLLSFLVTANVVVSLKQFHDNDLPNILKQLPDMVITEGSLLVRGPQPVIINDRYNKPLVYIDINLSESQMREKRGQAKLLVGETFMFMETKNGLDRRSFEGIRRMTLTPEKIRNIWPSTKTIILFLFPLLIIGQFFSVLLMAFFVALCSFIVTAFTKEEYIFETRMRMATVALTPPTILSKLLLLLMSHQTQIWFDILLSLFYFYVMIIVSRKLIKV